MSILLGVTALQRGPTRPNINDMHAVDGISGGTITSDGVSDMLYERLNMYLPYFKKQIPAIEVDSVFSELESTVTLIDSIIQ